MAALPATRVTNNEGFILPCYKPFMTKQVMEGTNQSLVRPVASVTADYLIGEDDAFGTREWREYWNVTVPKVHLSVRFYETFWFQPDAIDPTRLNCETHLPPVLCPTQVQKEKSGQVPFCLEVVSELMTDPKQGNSATFAFAGSFDQDAYDQIAKIVARSLSWLVLRREPLVRDVAFAGNVQAVRALNQSTNSHYEEAALVLDLAAVVVAHHTVTGQRYLGDDATGANEPYSLYSTLWAWAGAAHRQTIAFCRETIQRPDGTMNQVALGNFSAVENSPSPLGLFEVTTREEYDEDHRELAVPALLKFPVE